MRDRTPLVCVLILTASAAFAANPDQARLRLEQTYPTVQTLAQDGRLATVYGTTLSTGASPSDAAQYFVDVFSDAFGANPDELVPGNTFNGQLTQPVMYDAESDSYKFTLVYYHQVRDGIPVFRSDLRLLVRNEPGYPLVLAVANLAPLGQFAVDPAATRSPNRAAAIDAARQHVPGLVDFTPEETVIYAAPSKHRSAPAVAITFVADNGLPATSDYEKWLFVADAATGAILYQENMILNATISGQVNGKVSPDHRADACSTEQYRGLPYARVVVGGTAVYANRSGFYSRDGVNGTVSVSSEVRGLYFDVNNEGGSDAIISQNVTAPATYDIFHNAGNAEFTTAEVNAYLEANLVRDMALAANPTYPTIHNQTNWPVNVNLNDTCNAYYDYSSINFFRAGGGCNNTGFGDVVHHEYGHHLVASGGSGQGAYGEGMSDTVAFLVTGRSQLGIGFRDCSEGIRNADNNFQYPCTGQIHYCGQLLSGCFWSLRAELQATEPSDWYSITRDLAINSILLHDGDDITPAIYTHVLTLDDDNGDLSDGTPHYTEITNAFAAHNMIPLPPPENDACADAIVACPGVYTGSTTDATNDGSADCGTSGSSPDVWYSYTPISNGTLTASLCDGTDYDTVMSIHTGCPGTSANDIACDDDGCSPGGPSIIETAVTAGQTYLIRVTGWSGSSGPFTLSLTGPNCGTAALDLSFPNGLPETLVPNTATTITVQIENLEENYVPGTGKLHFRLAGGGSFAQRSLTHISGDLYEVNLSPYPCGVSVEYYFSAQGDGGTTVTAPAGAPTNFYSAVSGDVAVVFEDNFETNQGWVAENLGASSGDWQRGVPVNDGGWDYDPVSDGDGSGSAFLTENQYGNTDVDDGAVRLTSPAMDLTGGEVTIAYEYFLRLTREQDNTDHLICQISTNGSAGPWIEIARHSTDGGLLWRHHEISQGTLDDAGVTLSDNVKFRFIANDATEQSIVEAGIDGFIVTSLQCGEPGACCYEDGLCFELIESACGGNWLGAGTTCDPNPCPQPTGACCYADGTCAVTEEGDCSGTWEGAATDCTPNPCPQPAGACCYADGSCDLTTELTCSGTWQGAGTDCDPNPCPQPTGACCQPNGACTVVTEADCLAAGGVFQGMGTTCQAETCGCAGDASCDGIINWRDIDFLVAGMNNNVANWEAQFDGAPTCSFENLDINGDGLVNWRDIDPFVDIMNTSCTFGG